MQTVTVPNGISSTKGHPSTRPSLLVPDRRLIQAGAKRGMKPTTLHLEEVRGMVVKQNAAQAPENVERSFEHLHMDFTGGRVTAKFLSPRGMGEELLVHENAYSQMAQGVLPGRGGSFLLEQARLSDAGEKLSTMSWAEFRKGNDKPRLFRTAQMRDADGTVRRMIRSQHSQGYATYDNVQFVNDLLSNSPELAQMGVIGFHVMDTGMRLRFVDADGDLPLRQPVPMVEAWNSEVGRRRVGLLGGMFRLVCTNGMGAWDKKSEFHWRHYGDADRISGGVKSAIEEIRTSASGVVDLYNKALNVGIDDAFAWMMGELEAAGATTAQRDRARVALTDPTTTEGGLLASVVDAVTLAAQEESDLFAQAEVEQFGARLLRRGLTAARDGRILVEA